MHVAAERSGIMRELLVERAISPAAYVRLLRSLHAIYAALEAELDRHAAHPAVAPVYFPQLARTARLAADLELHHGAGWAAEVTPVQAADAYARHLHDLGTRDPGLLVAHAYARYLGDLSGGQLLAPLVAAAAGLPADRGFSFYEFPALDDVGAFKARFRAGLDAIPSDAASAAALVAEANHAFALHVRLFEELATRPAP
jgi:heme oxygenase